MSAVAAAREAAPGPSDEGRAGSPPVLREADTLVPGYQVVDHLHRSNVLDVYDVWSEERDCRCAIKTLRPDRRGDRNARAALLREGDLLRRLTHPHLVRAYEVVTEPEVAVVLETLTGETLAHLIERRGRRRLALREIAFLGQHLCSAAHYLHRQGHLHLDLKPSNVVAELGRAKVIDLSIARRPGHARAGLGTWRYMSPEQLRGGELGAPADVWGVGAVLYEAAAGVAAFAPSGEGRSGDARRIPEPLSDRRRVPAAFAELVASCLALEPAARPSLESVAERLDELAGPE